jgi:hypothetical protein
MTVEQWARKFINEKRNVIIHLNDEIGQLRYAVQVVDTTFWLDSFLTKDEAINFCNNNELPIKAIYE